MSQQGFLASTDGSLLLFILHPAGLGSSIKTEMEEREVDESGEQNSVAEVWQGHGLLLSHPGQ